MKLSNRLLDKNFDDLLSLLQMLLPSPNGLLENDLPIGPAAHLDLSNLDHDMHIWEIVAGTI